MEGGEEPSAGEFRGPRDPPGNQTRRIGASETLAGIESTGHPPRVDSSQELENPSPPPGGTPSASPLLEIVGLEVGPPGDPRVRGVDLALQEGEHGVLRGPSGSGKSQVLRAIAGLEPARWERARLLGRDFEEWTPSERRGRAIYLHQEPARLSGSSRDNLERMRGLSGSRPEPWERTLERWSAVGLGEEQLDRDATSLSGGEAWRMALVRALQLEPAILLLDEPTASLDTTSAAEVVDVIRAFVADKGGRAALWVVHDDELAERIADRTFRLDSA